jgi:hypothetical protein
MVSRLRKWHLGGRRRRTSRRRITLRTVMEAGSLLLEGDLGTMLLENGNRLMLESGNA